MDAIDALTLAVPVILRHHGKPREEVYSKVASIIRVTRGVGDQMTDVYARAFVDILGEVLDGKDLRQTIESTVQKYFKGSVKEMVSRSPQDPMAACYIAQSFPVLCYFAYKYADSPEKAVLANANAGGENVARGSLLGAIMGAAHGTQGWPKWCTDDLYHKKEITDEIESFF